ncbi:MAG: aromatic-ring-hydroxylating dioxygenase subunit beta [Candidatus Velthaea sp.]
MKAALPVLERADAEALLYREAALLDAGELEEWLTLFAADATYWVPENDGDDPHAKTSVLYDDRGRMEDRVWRLLSGSAHAQIPPSRTVRFVTNVRIGERAGDVTLVHSNLLIVEARKERTRIVAGRVEHRVRPHSAGWTIAQKKIDLVDRSQALYNLTFVL